MGLSQDVAPRAQRATKSEAMGPSPKKIHDPETQGGTQG